MLKTQSSTRYTMERNGAKNGLLQPEGKGVRHRVVMGARVGLVVPPTKVMTPGNPSYRPVDTRMGERVGGLRAASAPNVKPVATKAFGLSSSASTGAQWISSTEIVYVAGSLGVVQNIETGAQRFFKDHTAQVTSLAFNRERQLVATGQMDTRGVEGPKICVWYPFGGMEKLCLFELTSHSDGISCLSFTPDGRYLLSVGFDNRIFFWEIPEWTVPHGRERFQRHFATTITKPISNSEQKSIPFQLVPSGEAIYMVAPEVVHKIKVEGGVHAPDVSPSFPHGHGKFSSIAAYGHRVATGDKTGCMYLSEHNQPAVRVKLANQSIVSAVQFLSHDSVMAGDSTGCLFIQPTMGGAVFRFENWAPKGYDGAPIEFISKPLVTSRPNSGSLNAFVLVVTCKALFKVECVVSPSSSEVVCRAVKIVQIGLKNPRSVHLHPLNPKIMAVSSKCLIKFVDTSTGILSKQMYMKAPDGREVLDARFSPDGNFIALALNTGCVSVYHFPTLIPLGTWRMHTTQMPKYKSMPDCRLVQWSPCMKFLAVAIGTDVLLMRLNMNVVKDFMEQVKGFIDLGPHASVGSNMAKRLDNLYQLGLYHHKSFTTKNDNSPFFLHKSLKGSGSHITSMLFSKDSSILSANSSEGSHLFWITSTGERMHGHSQAKDVDFDQPFTHKFSWATVGLWNVRDIDGGAAKSSSLNSVATNHSQSLVATVNDNGKLRLFNFPSTDPNAAHTSGIGHSNAVTDVLFRGDYEIFTSGASDDCVIQWELKDAHHDEALTWASVNLHN